MFARLLGPLEIELAGRPVPLGGRAPRALLARLLLDANRAVAVDRLVEDLWGEEAPASAVKMIQIHVSALRKVLPEGMLVTRSRGYALEIDADAVDLARFEALRREGQEALAAGSHELAADRLREAAGLWRGPALGEFDEPFAAIESARLEELRVASIEDRIEAPVGRGVRKPDASAAQRRCPHLVNRGGRGADPGCDPQLAGPRCSAPCPGA